MKNLHISFVLSMLFLISACSTETVETTENTETGNKHQSSMDLATAWVTASLTSQKPLNQWWKIIWLKMGFQLEKDTLDLVLFGILMEMVWLWIM